jgi:hypothetical protein
METQNDSEFDHVFSKMAVLSVLFGLYFTTFVNYLLFHTLCEGFSIVVASSIFVIAWNSKKYIKNPYILFVGIAYFFIAILDMLHTLSYKGMNVFTDYDYYANQLWICARYMESGSLLLGFVFLRKDVRMPNVKSVFVLYSLLTAGVILSVFYWKNFPVCFIDGTGLTPFKKNSEYVICSILVVCGILLQAFKNRFERKIYILLLWSIAFTIISELAFTFYVDNYGLSNLVGHYFKIFSFLTIYESIVKTGIENPLNLIFLELDRTNKKLLEEIETRIKTEKEKEHLIDNLKKALDEIDTLKGILPLCSFCKKIRNDKGDWEAVDIYIHKHSKADISHSICPECVAEHYPEYLP